MSGKDEGKEETKHAGGTHCHWQGGPRGTSIKQEAKAHNHQCGPPPSITITMMSTPRVKQALRKKQHFEWIMLPVRSIMALLLCIYAKAAAVVLYCIVPLQVERNENIEKGTENKKIIIRDGPCPCIVGEETRGKKI
jgi:hypothetical protein